jgi:ketosteroid isomerase-like protein
MKKMKKSVLLSVLAIFTSFGINYCSAQSMPMLEQAKKEIAASNAVFHSSFTKNDSTIFLNCYADDACMIAPNSSLICGKAELAKLFRAGYNAGVRSGQFVTTHIYGDGIEYVTEEGIGKIFDKAGNLIDEANYLVLWKKTSNGWKMFRDMFSSDKSAK